MRKTPSYLKGLAETRARAAGDVLRLERLQSEIAAKLQAASNELAACDTLIRKFDARLNPEHIEPIKGWQGRYGKRGALRLAITECLRGAAPEAISTSVLLVYLEEKLRLEFSDSHERSVWTHNSLTRALKTLCASGEVERLHDPTDFSGEVGRWRWKSDAAPSLDHLRAQAVALGVGVQQADDGRA